MKRLLVRATLAVIVTVACSLYFVPDAMAQRGVTSSGTDFWLGFMPNSFSPTCCPPQAVEIFIGSETANIVSVDVYGGNQTPQHQQEQMTANTIWTLSSAEPSSWETDSNEHAAFLAIHVYAKNPIVVYGYQYTGANTSSADSYLALPTPALGTEYYPSCYYDDSYPLGPSNPLAGQFLLISPYNNTTVTIGPVKSPTRVESQPQTPSAVTTSHNRGDTWTVTLMKGQTYLVQSTGLNYGDDDITGTHIVSSKPIALLSGHQLCSIPIGELAQTNGSKDEIMEMIPSLDKWGSEYYDMPTATRTVCGDMVRVIAGEDGEIITAASTNGNVIADLVHAGDFYDFDLVTDPTAFSSEDGKPFLAVQMAYSQGYNGDLAQADPFSTVLPSRQQFQKEMIFNIPDRTGVPGFVHYATFLCHTDTILKLLINGKPITSYISAGSAVIPGTYPSMSAYRIQLPGTATVYTATGGAPFGCYLTGWAMNESYGSPASMAQNILSTGDTLPPLAFTVDSMCGSYHLVFWDSRSKANGDPFNDTHIASVSMITASGDLRWPTPSDNYVFTPDPNFQPGDSVMAATLTLINPAENAYAAIDAVDLAGNDTVYQYSYSAPNLTSVPTAPFEFDNVLAGSDSCEHITFTNATTHELIISNASIEGVTANNFTLSPATISRALAPGDSILLQLCFAPSDTLNSFDTLIFATGCVPLHYPLEGLGVTPLIYATDLDFGEVDSGKTKCLPLTIRNPGNAPLTITSSDLVNDSNFSADANVFPIVIPVGGFVTIEYCFHPQSWGSFSDVVTFLNLNPAAFKHSIKDTSLLSGTAGKAGVNPASPNLPFALSISPNPASGIATISLSGMPSANVEIFDVLGREVASFRITGSYEWQMGALPAGTYIVRAEASGTVVSLRVVKE